MNEPVPVAHANDISPRAIVPVAPGRLWAKVPSKLEIAGLVAGGLGFVISAESTSTSWIDGKVSSFTYTDVAAQTAGAVVICLGVAALFALPRTRPGQKALRLCLITAILGLGGLHVARGSGAFASPPSPKSFSAHMPRPWDFGHSNRLVSQDQPAVSDEEFNRAGGACEKRNECEEFERIGVPACRREPRFCNAVALHIHYMGKTNKVDLRASRAAFRRACTSGTSSGACKALAWLFDEQLKEDSNAAPGLRSILEAACTNSNKRACANLSWMLSVGLGGPTKPKEALTLAKRACDGDYAVGCLVHGVSIVNSKRDLSRARLAFKRGCDLQGPQSCWNLAIMFDRGDGGGKSGVEVERLARQACGLGVLKACEAMKIQSAWIHHPSHPNAVLFQFAAHRVGSSQKLVRSTDKSVGVDVLVKKPQGGTALQVSVAAGGKSLALGAFPRDASVEALIHEQHLFVLVHEHTERGKITSTQGFRLAVGKDKVVTRAGAFRGKGRVDWKTASPQ